MKTSSLEEKIITILKKEKIKFQREKTYPDLKFGYYRFDFLLPQHNLLIEVDGAQHYKFSKLFHKKRQDFLKAQERDRRKNSYALSHNIPLYRIPYFEIENINTFQDIIQDKFLVKDKWHCDNVARLLSK
jgi:very-short-patch-repair endonuclease